MSYISIMSTEKKGYYVIWSR